MSESVRDSVARFSDRANDYVKYRPHYSPEVVHALQQACGLRPGHVVADVGCGPGLLAEILLKNGNRVIGVEPNLEMRAAGEQYLARYANFSTINGSAENTTLADGSMDFVTAGQAFHWFRPKEARTEFVRILKPHGWTVLVWHDRDTQATPFLRAYDNFLQTYSIDYQQVNHKTVASLEVITQFFGPNSVQTISQQTRQLFDFDGLRGRLLSSSYVPKEGAAAETMLQQLPDLFSKYAKDGRVTVEYETKIYYGHLIS
ncbi:MAG TPA: class I SAM-dependent methyltransferase [Terriglobales bacterium]|jgi:ubiquinone/menaquinone biosynthesis C-methylase UbiE